MQTPGAKPSFSARITRPEPAPEWSAVLAVFFFIAFLILWIAGQALVLTVGGESFNVFTPGTLVGGAAIACIIIALTVIQWARRRFGPNWITTLRLRQPATPPVFVIVLVGLGAAWAIDLVGVLTSLKADQIVPPVLEALREPIGAAWVIAAIFAVVIQPLAEGLVFVGIIYPILTKMLRNNWFAAAAVAAIYTFANAVIFNPVGGVWFLLIQPFLMMFVVTLVRAYTQSTQSAIVARALFGLFFVLAALISLRF
jgi:membrane protease YdiL (CAAX protease family)